MHYQNLQFNISQKIQKLFRQMCSVLVWRIPNNYYNQHDIPCTIQYNTDKLYLLRWTQHAFIWSRVASFHLCNMFQPFFRPTEGMSIQRPHKGRCNKIKSKVPWILSCYVFLCDIFVLTRLMMAWERAKTCRIHVKTQLNFKYTCVVFKRISVVYLAVNAMGWLP
jgi:hypothetical protein